MAEDGFVIANFGIEGAKILGKAASKTSQGSAYVNLYNFHICEEPKLKVCALGAGGGKLNIHGNFTDDNTCIDDDYDDWELEYRARGYLSPESNEDLK